MLGQVRIVGEDGSVKRVSKDTLIPVGSRILVPRRLLADLTATPVSSGPSPAAEARNERLIKGVAAQLQGRLLHIDKQLLVLDKPAGLPVQGGPGIEVSLDAALRVAPWLDQDEEDPPRLVHRLDRETSGAIVVARTADAAAWLSQAFCQHAADAVETPARGSQATSSRSATSHLKQGARPGIRGDTLITSVEKTYLALVETAGMYQTLPDTGRVDLPILSGKGDAGESWRAAATAFRVLARSQDFTLLELRPETGRKHQIRIHCKHMGCAVVGDSRHGTTRSVAQTQLLASLEPDARRAAKGRLMLHARSIVVTKRGGAQQGDRRYEGRSRVANVLMKAEAPVPEHFQALIDALGFAVPSSFELGIVNNFSE